MRTGSVQIKPLISFGFPTLLASGKVEIGKVEVLRTGHGRHLKKDKTNINYYKSK